TPNCSIFTAPLENLAITSSLPPSAAMIRLSVDICISDWFSSLERLGCLIPSDAASSRWLFPARFRTSLKSISANSSRVRRRARARVFFVVVRITSWSNDLAILPAFAFLLRLDPPKMQVVKLVSLADQLLVKPPLAHARLIAADQQNPRSIRVE